jgi:4-diphosphocytidyl-2-C-methyl-D-erythritol kinase
MIRLLAPAKINLGLEILGRRPDGYHEIRSILAPISIFDRIEVERSPEPAFWTDDPRMNNESNLAARAAASLGVPVAVRLWKRIPAAAGLGGASSDAAAVLRSLAILQPEFPAEALDQTARALGSDVPFFLGPGPAVASGRGDRCAPIVFAAPLWLVVAAPPIEIPEKTARLYRSLVPDDFTDGSRTDAAANALTRGAPLATNLLTNAFERALYAEWPEARTLRDGLAAAGAGVVALSGAGPAHYAVCENLPDAANLATSLRCRVGSGVQIFVCRTLTGQTPIQRAQHSGFRTDGPNRT